MRRRAALAALASLLHRPAEAAAIESFDFVALGDMPYGPDLIQGQAYRQLIDQINALGLPLTMPCWPMAPHSWRVPRSY